MDFIAPVVHALRFMSSAIFALSTGVGMIVVSGCSTAPTAQQPRDPSFDIRVGMSPAQLEQIMGQPDSVEHTQASVAVYVYHRTIATGIKSIATSMHETPWFDPINNRYLPIKEPTVGQQRYELIEEVRVSLTDDTVSSLLRSYFEQKGSFTE